MGPPALGAYRESCAPRAALQGIGKLEAEMQQLRGILASFAGMMGSLKGLAEAAPSQCAPAPPSRCNLGLHACSAPHNH